MSWWDAVRRESDDWIVAQLGADQVPGAEATRLVRPHNDYLSIHLQSLRIAYTRKITTRFHGAVYSFAGLPHRSGQKAEFNSITTPGNLRNIDPDRVDRVVQMSKRIVGPIPYRGGDLELDIGLFSVRVTDLAAPFLDLLEELSGAAGVAFVSTMMPFLRPLRKGIEAITGGNSLEVGLSRVFPQPSTGWFVVIAAPKGSVNVASIRIDPQDHRIISPEIERHSYLVFEISAADQRDDWYLIPELQSTYRRLQKEAAAGEATNARAAFQVFRRAVLTNDDLLAQDAQYVVDAVERELTSIQGNAAMFPRAELPPLEALGVR